MKTPNPSPSACSCVNLRRASRAITRIYDNALEPVQLKITQYSVLANVLRSGPLSASSLARLLRLDRTTLVRNLKALEGAGFIEEHAEKSDPRERNIGITATGRALVERAHPFWRQAQKKIANELGPDGLQQLSALVTTLEELSDGVEDPEP